jgi:hypothetical protein
MGGQDAVAARKHVSPLRHGRIYSGHPRLSRT